MIDDERAQNAFEYLLVTGVIVVAFVGALIAGVALLIPEVVGYVCPSVDPLGGGGVGSCLGF
ncbi:MAG: hypothetical protein Kow0010_00760 [Dehalococcoidia bacterium]